MAFEYFENKQSSIFEDSETSQCSVGSQIFSSVVVVDVLLLLCLNLLFGHSQSECLSVSQ